MKNLILAAAALLGTACVHRNLTSVRDVPNSNITLIETADLLDLYVYKQVKHVFWQCQEKARTLTCERACGAGTDLECPTAEGLSVSSSNLRSNVR